MRIPLDLVKRGEQVISWYVGGKHILINAVSLQQSSSSNLVNSWRRQPIRNVNLPRAFEGFPWPMTNGLELGQHGIPVGQYRRRRPIWSSVYSFFVPTSVAPYSIIPSVMNWRFCGVLSNYHFGPREAGKSLMNSSSRDAFNAPNTCCSFVGPVPNEGVASSSVRFFFFLLYIQCSLLIFLHFIFADYWERDRERPSLVTPSL